MSCFVGCLCVTAVLFFCGSLFLTLVIQIIDVLGAFDLLVNVLREYLQFKFLVLWTRVPNLLWFEIEDSRYQGVAGQEEDSDEDFESYKKTHKSKGRMYHDAEDEEE